VELQVVGGTLQVAGSAPAAPQLAAVLLPKQVALLQSLRPLISQQQQQQQRADSQESTAHEDAQVSSNGSPSSKFMLRSDLQIPGTTPGLCGHCCAHTKFVTTF
jgi:hypothetical protein